MTKNKKQQTKTTKHTIEFSNNTPGTSVRPREKTRGNCRLLVVRTGGTLRDHEVIP
jgi:hypothetical protein